MTAIEKELKAIDLWLARNRQAEADYKAAEAKTRKAEAALQKFYANGPHKKKKSGRPSFWKSPQGLFFVMEVDDIRKDRNCKITKAIKSVRNKTIQRTKWCQADGLKGPVAAATLAKLPDDQLPVRYQEARRYWSFLIDPESHQREEQSLKRNFDEAFSAWSAALTAWQSLIEEARPLKDSARRALDFS
jgi:hypothetical protein